MYNNEIIDQQDFLTKEITRDFFKQVYGYMFAALGISGIIAYLTGTPEFIAKVFLTAQGTISPMFYVAMFAPVALALIIQTAYRRLSLGVLMVLFVAYAAVFGVSMGVIFLAYSGVQIATTFLITAGAFAGMAILGYTTKTDLTKMGSLLYMVFIGIFIASIVNLFMENSMLDFIISVIGVFVFTGLTAFYMQKLKYVAEDNMLSGVDKNKLALVGGLQLYILFVNLFLSLLRILNSRD